MVNIVQSQKSDQFYFIWLDCINRFNLEIMQNNLLTIFQTSDANKTMVLNYFYCFNLLN